MGLRGEGALMGSVVVMVVAPDVSGAVAAAFLQQVPGGFWSF